MNIQDFVWHRVLRRPFRLAVKVLGDGEPVVLLHGIGSTGDAWQPLVKQLGEENWRIIRPDLLGFGDSPRPVWSKYTVDDHARSVMTTLRRSGIKQPVTIVGHSMGCLVAAHIAIKYPRRVKRLVLYAPPLFVDDPEFQKHARKREQYFAFFEYVAAHPRLAFLPHRRLWRVAKRLFKLDLDEEKWLPFERSLRNTIMAQRAYDEFVRLRVPTDIVHGRFDIVVVRTQVEAMLKANPNITLHKVAGTHGVSRLPAKLLANLLHS